MTSTEINLGITDESRPSSRVLKPPGGGHTNIFGESEVAVNAPRPKYNQQNSSNLNACLGSTDPNQKVEKLREEISHAKQPEANSHEQKAAGQTSAAIAASSSATANNTSIENTNSNNSGRTGRVPPGGYSSGGFW